MFKTGSQAINLGGNTRYVIQAETPVTLFRMEAGELVDMVGTAQDGRVVVRAAGDVEVFVKVGDGAHWTYEAVSFADASDPVPAEIPDDAKFRPSLEEKLRNLMRAAVVEMYGAQSTEVETVDEFMDFDVPEEMDPLSGYEVTEALPEEPVVEEPAPDPSLPVDQDPTSVEQPA